MKKWLKAVYPEIPNWQAELIAECAQPKRTWVGLTDEEMVNIAYRKCWRYRHSSNPNRSHTYKFNHATLMEFKYAIDAKLKEKNT